MKTIKPQYHVPLITLFIFIFQEFASRTGSFIANPYTYSSLDKHGVFVFISIHHIVQALIALLLIVILVKTRKMDFGFGLGDVSIGVRHTLVFSAIIFVYVIISYALLYISGSDLVYNFPLNTTNILGTLGFQLLLSGTSEEILFRALPITLLACGFKSSKYLKIHKLEIPVETIIAAVLFSIAHVSWRINPFMINANIFQLIISFIYGIFYGIAYQKSKSVIYPMIMHGISNFLMVGIGYICAFVFR